MESHENHDGIHSQQQFAPSDLTDPMSSDESKARCIVPMGNRDTGVSRRCNRGTDSRNDLVRHAGALKGLRFLAAAAENEGIIAFQAGNNLAFQRMIDE